MGVDSGLPDFRGDEGFWAAYPPFRALGLPFAALANPRWFHDDPHLAWGFYGHRLELYRRTTPHDGFAVLLRRVRTARLGGFVFTSNVDGAFQKAGFDAQRIVECHGSIHHVQCTAGCGLGVVAADRVHVEVDPTSFRAADPLPSCPRCGALLRPNILMFGDGSWNASRTDAQDQRFDAWLDEVRRAGGSTCVVECGAGAAIPTVRATSERIARVLGGALVRINVREPDGPEGTIAIAQGARAALDSIERTIG